MYTTEEVEHLLQKQITATVEQLINKEGLNIQHSSYLELDLIEIPQKEIEINKLNKANKIKKVNKQQSRKEKIWSTVQLRIDDVTLTIDTDSKLKQRLDVLKNNGYINIHYNSIDQKDIFWDNLEFFISVSFKEFKEVCREDLEKIGYNKKETFKIIKSLIKKAVKLKLLSRE